FAAVSTWLREIDRLGIQRPRKRLHPRRSKVGVRASRPNELWHIDASCVRLLDGTVRWLHGVIDNHSRKILAWTVGTSCRAAATETLLRQAIAHLPAGSPPITVITDGGSENTTVGHPDFDGLLHQVRAQVDVTFSNSMIESFWNQLKHRWLFLHHLDSEETLVRLSSLYVEDHNTLIPRAALRGRTPDEVYTDVEPDLPERIAADAILARRQRLLSNQALAGCGGCDGPVQTAPRREVLDSP
ncbi:MAG: DDE-type integrase/transposase/recombinase, partial [Polyangiales bacterium]